MSERWYAAHLTQLDDAECWELAATHQIARVAFLDEAGPMVVPVTFVLDGRSVVFRTAPYSSLGRRAPGTVVAVEVDEIDDVTQSGWSVVLRGTLEVVHPDEYADLAERPEPWAEGLRSLYLRLEPDGVSGRRLLPA